MKSQLNFIQSSLVCGGLFAVVLGLLAGCGQRNPPQESISILRQPDSITVPLGSTGTFVVTLATQPNSLRVQWYRDGEAISGANSLSYTTPAVTAADAGNTYYVVLSLGDVSATSSKATISVGPRSPISGDLRFQQVGAQSTRYQYSGLEGSNLNYGLAYQFDSAIGTPLSIGPGCSNATNPYGCTWGFEAFSTALTDPSLSVRYNVDYLANWPEDLEAANSKNAVITGLDIEPTANAVAYSSEQNTSGTLFSGTMQTMAASSLLSSVAAEGIDGRVVTAITSNSNSAISYLSYSSSSNAGTQYDETIVTSAPDNLPLTVASLAKKGYIITAMGRAAGGQIYVVGAKVLGDNLSRESLAITPTSGQDLTQITSGGYAIVGYLFITGANGSIVSSTYIGEN